MPSSLFWCSDRVGRARVSPQAMKQRIRARSGPSCGNTLPLLRGQNAENESVVDKVLDQVAARILGVERRRIVPGPIEIHHWSFTVAVDVLDGHQPQGIFVKIPKDEWAPAGHGEAATTFS